MRLLNKIQEVTAEGYSVNFRRLSFHPGLTVSVRNDSYVSSWQLTQETIDELPEDYIGDILDKLVEDVKCLKTTTDGIVEKYKEN